MVKCNMLDDMGEKFDFDITGSQENVVSEMIYLIFKFAELDSPIKGEKDLIKGCIYALCMCALDLVEENYGNKNNAGS